MHIDVYSYIYIHAHVCMGRASSSLHVMIMQNNAVQDRLPPCEGNTEEACAARKQVKDKLQVEHSDSALQDTEKDESTLHR